jgi:uncharacterized protein YgiM (DUF1202 family)
MNIKATIVAIVLALITSPLLAADQVYVSSKKVALYQEPSYKAEQLTQMTQGDGMELIEQQGNWYNVQLGGMKGWVPRYSVSETPPPEKLSFFGRIKRFFSSDSSRARVSSVSTAGGIRGLADGETENSGKRDYEALDEMEKITVNEKEVEEFIESNKP